MELESDYYDVIVLGTGLAESIAAASLAKSGKSVLQLDPNDYYGGEQASLTLDELRQWVDARAGPSTRPITAKASSSSSSSSHTASQRSKYSHASITPLSPQLTADQRRYALSLFPSVVPSRGKLIDVLIASNVSKYVSFRMLDSVSVWQGSPAVSTQAESLEGSRGSVKRVPGSKEEVFKDKTVGLVDKRRLMKFLMFAAGNFEQDEILQGKENRPLVGFLQDTFSIPPHLATQITYAIAHCTSPTEPTLPALLRTRRYLKSIGRYGSGAFLVGQYGGAGEVAQGFCRACAVFGGTYVLGSSSIPETLEVEEEGGRPVIKVKLPCHPKVVTAKHLVASPGHLPASLRSKVTSAGSARFAHCIAIVSALPDAMKRAIPTNLEEEDRAESLEEDDTAIVVFPPGSTSGARSIQVLIMGEGTGSCPAGQFVLYLSTEVSDPDSATVSEPKTLLQPFLHSLDPGPIFESYYLADRDPNTSVETPHLTHTISPAVVILEPYGGSHMLTEGVDWEAAQGEAAFWAVSGDKEGVEDGKGFFDRTAADEEQEEDFL